MNLQKCILLKILCLSVICTGSALANTDWQERLKAEVPVMGHRNWIIIADSAYPKQSSPGIETIYTGAEHIEVLKTVLAVRGHPKCTTRGHLKVYHPMG